jgi:hypothetical protein
METQTITAQTATKSLVEVWSADMAINKREKADMERGEFIRNNPDIPKPIRNGVSAWLKQGKEGCWIDVSYEMGKNAKLGEEALGRMNVKGNIGLQGFPRDIRNALAQRIYWDIDMVAAHPTIARQISKFLNLPTKYQDELIENRTEKVAELMDLKECSKDLAKVYITSLYFGEEITYASLPEFYKNLYEEVDTTRKVITQHKDWSDALRFLNGKKKNRLGSAFAFILQSIERVCLFAMEKSAKKNGRSLDTYIHDGGLIRKREGEDEFPDELLRIFEDDIEKETGYRVSLISKPMETSFVFAIKDNNAYLEMKEKFENKEKVFSIKYPPIYAREYDGDLQMLEGNDINKNYQTWSVGDDRFIDLWKNDPTRKEFEKFEFLPGMKAPPHLYNLFRGFKVQPRQNDALIERWVFLIYLVANKDEAVKNWLLDYLAHMFQKPYEKPGVAIVVKGKKGSGKDTPFDKIGELLGDMFYNTGTPEKSVFSSFNGMMMRNIMVKFEEATYGNGKTYEETLKYFITTPTLDIQKKGKDQFNVKNYSRFIFTTNNDIPVIVSDDERRYCLIQTSDEKRGDRAFWNETYAIMKQEGFNEALMYFLLNRDISNFEARNYPKTLYGESVKQAFIPNHALYFRQWIERNDEMTEFSEQAFKIRDKINEMTKHQITHPALAKVVMEDYDGIITKTKTNNKTVYHFTPDGMRQHLQAKGWWVEM